jgi:hypothetical protein
MKALAAAPPGSFEITDGLQSLAITRYGPIGNIGLAPGLFMARLRQRLTCDMFLRRRLADWYRRTSGLDDDDQIIASLLRDLEHGWLRAYEIERPVTHYTPIVPRPEDDPAPPPPSPEPIVDDPRALFITRCDPQLGLDGPLRFSYMIRGLAGRPATLRIVSEQWPGRVVHERGLPPVDTSDGVHDDSWDGRVVHPGEQAPRRLLPEFGPCTLEIEHDQVYRDEAVFTIAEPDYTIEFADLHFATKGALLLPATEDAPDLDATSRASPLHVIAALLEFAADHPEREIVVHGHTDTVGGDTSNDALARERARNVQLYLAGEREAWAAHCQEHYAIVDFKRVHRWAAERFGWSTDPGALDNEWTSTPRKARAEFRRCCDALLGTTLKQNVKQNPGDWQAIFDLYEIAVAGYLACRPEDLPALRGAISFADPPVIACGERWPVVGVGQDGVAERLNRRVEVNFFQPGELPDAHGSEDPPGEALYASGRYRQIRLAPVGSDEALLHITLLDEHGDPIAQAGYTAKTRAGPWTGTADGSGVATVPRALVDTTFLLEWTPAGDGERRYWSRHMLVTDGETERGLLARLANLGFQRGGDPHAAVDMFQRFFGLPPTGELDDIAELVNAWYETRERPQPNPDDYDWPDDEHEHDDEDDHGHD